MRPLHSFPLLLLLAATTTLATSQCSSSPNSDISIFHLYSPCSPFAPPAQSRPTWLDTIQTMARQDPSRLAYLTSLAKTTRSTVPVASANQIMQAANYIVKAKLGSPAQSMFMVLDTSSDSGWVPCSGCVGCNNVSGTLFSATNSTTYTALECADTVCGQVQGAAECPETGPASCSFSRQYGGDSVFSAVVSRDSLTLGGDIVQNYLFGCVNSLTGTGNSFPKQGLLGLGRGPTSLMSQTQDLYNGVFSYCLPSFKSYYFSGSLRFGPSGQPRAIRTTPLLRNQRRSSLYYVNMTGISVGRTVVNASASHLAFDPVTGGGTIVDSGTVITRFVEPLYQLVRDEFRRQVGATEYSSLGAFDTCFEPSGGQIPTVTLHFVGLDLTLPVENTLIHSSAGAVACLAMAAAPANVNSVLNVIANLQQQNYRVLFDVVNSKVGFVREACN